MRVLVTGGAGFIGSHLVDRLLADDHDVTVVDDFSTGKEKNLEHAAASPRLRVERVDVTTEAVDDVVARSRPEVIHHLAAQIDVRRSVEDPVHDALVNLVGTIRLLEAARRSGTGKFVFTSSGGCVYGEPTKDQLPVGEDHPGHPHSPYGASKRSVDEYLHAYHALYGLRWTSLALANVYGPRQDPLGEAGVVSIFGGRMLQGRTVTIFGDGRQTRDFVYVADVVAAFAAAMQRGDGLRVNIGTGEQTSVLQLHEEIAAVTGHPAPPEFAPDRPGELRHIALDTALAGAELGWKPATSLTEGLIRTLEWLRG